ncbi:hypothetical protein NC99_11760 [Sunxiuqinia dokdonensis]|uniref:Uncharacterized protein n=1 Tax=Sunxiuqinia dokdonensis TaxID=1409788 RepID=A0A0L8VCB9_9BACT|nr:hypothetical protein NC99_11760 [Sunxiuqinia dokdonensis]
MWAHLGLNQGPPDYEQVYFDIHLKSFIFFCLIINFLSNLTLSIILI